MSFANLAQGGIAASMSYFGEGNQTPFQKREIVWGC